MRQITHEDVAAAVSRYQEQGGRVQQQPAEVVPEVRRVRCGTAGVAQSLTPDEVAAWEIVAAGHY